MLTSIHIQGFKNFKDTKIEPLRKVNLILGGQNVGKTSLLEAVLVGTSEKNDLIKLPEISRGMSYKNDIEYFFESVFVNGFSISFDKFRFDTCRNDNLIAKEKDSLENIKKYSKPAEYKLHKEDFETKLVAINNFYIHRRFGFSDKDKSLFVSVNLPSEIGCVNLFGQVFEKRKKKNLIQLLRNIEPRLEDMNTSNLNSEWRIYVDIDGNRNAVPISHMGHGFSRLFNLYASLLVTDSKLALIDEIENGIHYSSLPTIFKGIQEIATNNDIQSLITTHSWECICAAYNVFAEAGRLEDFQLIRLEQDGDNVRAVLINDEDLDTIMEAGHEIR